MPLAPTHHSIPLPSRPACRCNSDTAGNTPAGYRVGESYCSDYDQKTQGACTDADAQWVVVPGAGEGPLRDGTDDTSPDVRCAPYPYPYPYPYHALCS